MAFQIKTVLREMYLEMRNKLTKKTFKVSYLSTSQSHANTAH